MTRFLRISYSRFKRRIVAPTMQPRRARIYENCLILRTRLFLKCGIYIKYIYWKIEAVKLYGGTFVLLGVITCESAFTPKSSSDEVLELR